LDISKITINAYKKFYDVTPIDINDIFTIDGEVRRFVKSKEGS
jgi:hypothetical protein